MSDRFYSPEDQLANERARLACPSLDNSTQETPNIKRQRLFYEGEPDTSKWAVPPAPGIFSQSSQPDSSEHIPIKHHFAHDKQHNVTTDSAEDSDNVAVPHPSPIAIQHIRNLCTAQNDFERRLYEHRQRIQHEHEKALRQLEARELIGSASKAEKDQLLRKHRAELERADKRAIEKLDDLRFSQQQQLQQLGVAGMYQTSNIDIIKQQQAFIQKLIKFA